jgi:hypothetical protein
VFLKNPFFKSSLNLRLKQFLLFNIVVMKNQILKNLDLEGLSDEEINKILGVLQRDLLLKKKEKDRLKFVEIL